MQVGEMDHPVRHFSPAQAESPHFQPLRLQPACIGGHQKGRSQEGAEQKTAPGHTSWFQAGYSLLPVNRS